MAAVDSFTQSLKSGYSFKGVEIIIGGAMFEKKCIPGLHIKMPLNTANRHGLISGATGTGKTKTVQRLSESLSEQGVSVLLMDIKGDLSGIAVPGSENEKITSRHEQIGVPWSPGHFPVEMLSISNEPGVRLRATISEFGPLLFSKILELNDNQQGVVNIVFKYCDDHGMALLDIKDFRSALNYITNEGKDEVKEYGLISPASAGVIMRKLLELEGQGADVFFGEKSFDVNDLVRKDEKGFGYISVLRLADMQEKPKLFSTFMLCLLAEVYARFPELGDKASPKLVIVIDEAHLIFKDATKALMDQLEMVIKLIRSKGVGIFFCTQVPSDIPNAILSQLGAKFQHSMRAFTAKDRKDIKLVAQNYPTSEFYNTESLLTELGIGEAIVTVLNEKGAPTPLAHTMICAPRTRMDVLSPAELDKLVSDSVIAKEYNTTVDRESAYEMLKKKLEGNVVMADKPGMTSGKEQTSKGIGDTIQAVTRNPLIRSVARELTRGLLGAIFGKSTRSR
jgi:DNA helicase HerA-like ATPase